MKKILSLICVLLVTLSSSGCLKKDDLDGATIYPTV